MPNSVKIPNRKGLLLINLGTPDRPEASDVRRYLKEFLMDPYVVDIPAPLRWFLVNVLILPRRSEASAAAYRKIWTSRGSPLLLHLDDLVAQVRTLLPNDWVVEGGMRYGNPSIPSAIEKLKTQGVAHWQVLPLYPQYTLAATQSSLEVVTKILGRDYSVVTSFYEHPAFVKAFVEKTEPVLKEFQFHPETDHILMSFHGLPERQVKRCDQTGNHCFKSPDCCEKIEKANANCYRAQCFRTADRIATGLSQSLTKSQYTVCFQSRLGRTPWIQPFTDVVYQELAKKGVKRLLVLCPTFVADCLETLEEIEIRGREQFRSYGGSDLRLVPSLNASESWAKAILEIANIAPGRSAAQMGVTHEIST